MRRPLFLFASAIVALAATMSCERYRPRHKGGIDPSTGLYTRRDEDLVVFDTVPLILERTYLSGDRISRQFGIGGTHPGEWYLIGDGATFQWAELILANGGRIHFSRTSPGTSAEDGVFEHQAAPMRFFGATLRWDSRGWLMTFSNGGTALFQHCHPGKNDVCSIVEQRDAKGHGIRYARDPSGLLLEMRGDSHTIAFTYDGQRRITRAEDSLHNWAHYTYDTGGRLWRVTTSGGTVRTYTYTSRAEMRTIDEPGWQITNEYDDNGRVIRQVTRYPDLDEAHTIQFAYTVRNGAVVQTDTTEYDGSHTRTTYNLHHYRTAEIIGLDGPQPVTLSFDRDDVTNVVRSVSVQCAGQEKRVDITTGRDGPEPDGLEIARRACGG